MRAYALRPRGPVLSCVRKDAKTAGETHSKGFPQTLSENDQRVCDPLETCSVSVSPIVERYLLS